jgi:glycosyltransferase involved in cell wall biosynthesis
MKLTPKLSVITVNLNNGAGLESTVKSVMDQTYSDFEYIIIDGGSTDRSLDIIKQYEDGNKRLKRFSWLSEKDTGIYNAMNKGINLSKGEYILFLNSGDSLVNPEILQKLFCADISADYVYGNINLVHNGELRYQDVKMNFETPSLSDLYTDCLPHQASFIKRELFQKYGNYDEKLRILGDWEFCIRTLIINNRSVQHLQITITNYDLGGISSTNKELNEAEKMGILDKYFTPGIISDLKKLALYKNDFILIDWLNSHRFYKSLVMFIYKIGKRASIFFGKETI